jgi:hypothetical protein
MFDAAALIQMKEKSDTFTTCKPQMLKKIAFRKFQQSSLPGILHAFGGKWKLNMTFASMLYPIHLHDFAVQVS